MNAQELRLGNWVDFNGTNVKIDQISEYETILTSRCKGIPLTDEILLKAGFKKIEKSIFENSINQYWAKDSICLLYNETDTRNIFLPSIGFMYNGKYFVGHDNNWIESLHALQNFYFVHKGKELEIKL